MGCEDDKVFVNPPPKVVRNKPVLFVVAVVQSFLLLVLLWFVLAHCYKCLWCSKCHGLVFVYRGKEPRVYALKCLLAVLRATNQALKYLVRNCDFCGCGAFFCLWCQKFVICWWWSTSSWIIDLVPSKLKIFKPMLFLVPWQNEVTAALIFLSSLWW